MKKLFLIVVVLIFPMYTQGDPIPKDLVTANTALCILASDESFELIAKDAGEYLKTSGFNIKTTVHFSDNPTIRKNNEERIKQEMHEKEIKYSISIVYSRIGNEWTYLLMIMSAESLFDSQQKNVYYTDSNKSLKKILEKLSKKLKK